MSINDFNDILYEKEESGICTITLNRPEIKNALSQRTFSEIETVLADMECDKNAKVLIITGCKEANAFSSGGYFDLKFFKPSSFETQRDKVASYSCHKRIRNRSRNYHDLNGSRFDIYGRVCVVKF
jgi:1,4-dihydroxy-2-naphthoyl-CoA synthase